MTASDHAPQRPQRFPLPERGRPQMVSGPSPQRTKVSGLRAVDRGPDRTHPNLSIKKCWAGRISTIAVNEVLYVALPWGDGGRRIHGPRRYPRSAADRQDDAGNGPLSRTMRQ